MNAQSLKFQFPLVTLANQVNDTTQGMVVAPFAKGRPFSGALPMPPLVTRHIERGTKVLLCIPEFPAVLLLPLEGPALLAPEYAIAEAVAAVQGVEQFDILLPETNALSLDIQLLTSFLVDQCHSPYNQKTCTKEERDAGQKCIRLVAGSLSVTDKVQVQRGIALGMARTVVRTLYGTPPNLATPSSIPGLLAEFVELFHVSYPGLKDLGWDALGKESLEVQKMGAFLGAAKGSVQAPVFLRMCYRLAMGDKLATADANLVGEGPNLGALNVDTLQDAFPPFRKEGLGGCAGVVGAMLYAAMTESPLRLRAFVPLCDNLSEGLGCKRFDVVTAYNGKSIEVQNPKMRGSLLLADALSYANDYLSTVTVDLSTMTQSSKSALGNAMAAILTDSDSLFSEFGAAGIQGKDKVWRLPMGEEFATLSNSDIADVRQGSSACEGGPIEAGVFLKNFVKYPDRWVHLDISNIVEIQGPGSSRPLGLIAKWLDMRGAAALG